ncbi:recombinase family protein (plasmid) [Rhodococcus opacus]|nr:recombinase family protein [Rhodococcus opacus]UOT08146.1 recombinase family protein [Rhodococcus opacus]
MNVGYPDRAGGTPDNSCRHVSPSSCGGLSTTVSNRCRKPHRWVFSTDLFGYVRVCDPGQDLDPQIDALRCAGVAAENIRLDHAAGSRADRPQLDRVLGQLGEGDVLVITRPAGPHGAAPDHPRRSGAASG